MPYNAADQIFALFDSFTNKKLISDLNKQKLKTILFPPVEAEKVVLETGSIELLSALNRFDWIIFTDALAVDFFLEKLTENHIDFFELDETRVCAFGENVSDRLRFAQLHADVIPNQINSAAVIETIKNYSWEKEFDQQKFFIVREKSLNQDIGKELQNLFAEFLEFAAYEINFQAKNEIVRLKTLLLNGAADVIIISSPEDLIALRYIFKDQPLAQVLSDLQVFAADRLIWQALKENEIKNNGIFHFDKIVKV